jgi:two-component system, cell cycle sensor histidine kinase and response regulator CckA
MPVVSGLMQSHNGLIDVQSSPGNGSSISLFFPMPTGPVPRLIEEPETSPHVVTGTERVMVVDDESDVGYFVAVILRAHGYDVMSARDAETALELIRACPDKIDLLFSDIGLPKRDGFSLSTEARKLKPGLKTILTSGYTDGSLKTRMGELGIDGFISKPYDATALLQTIRAILDKP